MNILKLVALGCFGYCGYLLVKGEKKPEISLPEPPKGIYGGLKNNIPPAPKATIYSNLSELTNLPKSGIYAYGDQGNVLLAEFNTDSLTIVAGEDDEVGLNIKKQYIIDKHSTTPSSVKLDKRLFTFGPLNLTAPFKYEDFKPFEKEIDKIRNQIKFDEMVENPNAPHGVAYQVNN